MKEINFYFENKCLLGAVSYLKSEDASPVAGKTDDEISSMLKEAAILIFKKEYEGKAIHPYRVNDGVLLGPVIWRGLMCTFGSFSTTSVDDPVVTGIDISAEFSGNLQDVSVNFYGHLAARV